MKYLMILAAVFMLGAPAHAADVTVEMLNKEGKERMVFSPKIVKIDVGQTVLWKATTKGHNVEFIKGGVPEGVDTFKSKMSKDVEFTFTKPGIYAYVCTPHKGPGMVGIVVVGDDMHNLEAVQEVKLRGKSKKNLDVLLTEISS